MTLNDKVEEKWLWMPKGGNMVTLNAWMSMHNGSECQTEEDDDSKFQTEDMALNAKLKTYDDGFECLKLE